MSFDKNSAGGSGGGVATLYTANGVITENRTVELSNSSNLNIAAFDQATHATSNEEAILSLDSNLASLELQQLDGAGNIDTLAGLSISTASGMVVTDSTDLEGLKYAIDYSATFVDRSLVDKAYSDRPILETVTQAAHGFVVGNPLCKLAGGTYVKAIADTVSNASALGVVSKVIDVNTFVITFSGVIGGLSGLTPGTFLFVSAVTAGDVTTTQPAISRVAFHAITATTAFVIADDVFVNEGNIYTTDGSTVSDRLFDLLSGAKLTITSNNTAIAADATTRSILLMQAADYTFGHDTLDGFGGITGIQRLTFNSASMMVFDTINTKGLEYAADYSVNFIDRSIVDKGYADLGHLSRVTSGAADLTSSGKPILAVTDSSAPRTVTIATADVSERNQFIVKDEGGLAGTNNITVTSATLSVTSVAAGSDFTTSTVHDYVIGQVIVHAGFADGTYNGLFTVTDIISTTIYEVSAISFNATDTGTSNIAIDNVASTTIIANYGSLTLYCTDNQIFSVGV